MPTLSPEQRQLGEQHLADARRQEAEAVRLRDVSPGYAITALWYAAFHYLHGYLLLRFGREVPEHRDMRKVWPDYPDLNKTIRIHYELLKTQSERFRYHFGVYTPSHVDNLTRVMEGIRGFLLRKLQPSPPPSSATPPPAPPP